MKLNEKKGRTKCWEYKKCGREKGGAKEEKLGLCPACPDNGRFCWNVAGTLCGGEVQGTFAQKKSTCLSCDFFLKVKDEEGDDFVFFPTSKTDDL